jgi:hypothetical protein
MALLYVRLALGVGFLSGIADRFGLWRGRSSGEEKWKSQADELQLAEQFQKGGGKLIRLEFPRTEIQRFGNVAILFSRYLLETEMHGNARPVPAVLPRSSCSVMATG